MAAKGKTHTGTLIVGAPSGDYYFFRDNDPPRKIREGSKLEKSLRRYLKTKPLEKATVNDLRNDLPQDIQELLEAAFGPLGIWHIMRRD